MKRFLILVCVTLLCGVVSAQAQSQTSEIVYLKDGSVLKGKVVEMLPDQIKVQTSDGSLFVYPMNEVERVEKERRNSYRLKTSSANQYDLLGWRGVVELGYIMGDFSAPEFSFSIGYQFNPYFFLGAGIGVDYHFDWETVFMPIFANARAYFIDGKISPFMDVKIGYSPVDDSGLFYFTPSVGVSFGTSKKCAVNLSIGYNLQRVMMYVYRYVPEYDHYNLLYDSRESLHGLSFKLGFEF